MGWIRNGDPNIREGWCFCYLQEATNPLVDLSYGTLLGGGTVCVPVNLGRALPDEMTPDCSEKGGNNEQR